MLIGKWCGGGGMENVVIWQSCCVCDDDYEEDGNANDDDNRITTGCVCGGFVGHACNYITCLELA